MLKCVQWSLREVFNSKVMEWFDVAQQGMSKKIWKEALVAAVEARAQYARPNRSIKEQIYQVTQEQIERHRVESMERQAGVEEERRHAEQKEGSGAQASSKAKHAEHVSRISEESMCRGHLLELEWLHLIPKDKGLDEEADCLEVQARRFCEIFTMRHTESWPPKMTNMRLLTVECMLSMDYLQSRGWMPWNLQHPHPRYIRRAANSCCSPEYNDPGNVTWDVVYHVLNLNQYVDAMSCLRVNRTAPDVYSSPSNRSSQGPVNLRGNVLESVLYDLQVSSAAQNPAAARWRTRPWRRC